MATRITTFISIASGNLKTSLRSTIAAHEASLKKLSASKDADDDDRRLAQSEFERLQKIKAVL